MRYVLAATVFIAAMAFDPGPVRAYGTAPWCAVVDVGWGDILWDCQYYTFEACVPNVLAGNRGFCNHNPSYVGELVPVHRNKVHRKRHINRD
jgi:hypothetical protein